MADKFNRRVVERKWGELGPLEHINVQLILGKERNA
jgi:hypothetical protein